MADFQEIKTQEEFERRLAERLSQKERSVRKEFEGFLSPDDVAQIKTEYQSQIDTLNETKSTLEAQVSEYETKVATYETDSVKTRIAMEFGIPKELTDRLKGSTEDELRADAQALANYQKVKAPLASSEEPKEDDEAYKKLIKDLED